MAVCPPISNNGLAASARQFRFRHGPMCRAHLLFQAYSVTEIIKVPATFFRRKVAKGLPKPEEGGKRRAVSANGRRAVHRAAGQQAHGGLVVEIPAHGR